MIASKSTLFEAQHLGRDLYGDPAYAWGDIYKYLHSKICVNAVRGPKGSFLFCTYELYMILTVGCVVTDDSQTSTSQAACFDLDDHGFVIS